MQQANSKTIISAESIQKVYTHFATRACEVLASQKSLAPQLFIAEIQVESGEMMGLTGISQETMNSLLSNPEGKECLGRLIEDIMDPSSDVHQQIQQSSQINPNIAILINEVWYVQGSDPESEAQALNKSISTHPQRKEGIFVAVYSDRGLASGLSSIERDENGAAHATVAEIRFETEDSIEGLLVPSAMSAENPVNKVKKSGRSH